VDQPTIISAQISEEFLLKICLIIGINRMG